MDRPDILWRVAQMASWPFQERFIVNATSDEYVLDTEVIENVDAIRYSLNNTENEASLSAAERSALDNLLGAVTSHSTAALENASREEAIRNIKSGDAWETLRLSAADTLEAFGVDRNPSIEEIERLEEQAEKAVAK